MFQVIEVEAYDKPVAYFKCVIVSSNECNSSSRYIYHINNIICHTMFKEISSN